MIFLGAVRNLTGSTSWEESDMTMKSVGLIFGLAVAAPLAGLADVRPTALFTDHMVIQRETQAPVWGTADPRESVTVSGSWGNTATTTADASVPELAYPEAAGVEVVAMGDRVCGRVPPGTRGARAPATCASNEGAEGYGLLPAEPPPTGRTGLNAG